jgi:adenosylcobyric acid synthase
MVQGVSSSAGKSLLVTALARWFARQGVRVAPFKGSNMSNNARVTASGEMGVAQWLQAMACGVEPDVAMNPILVKPEATGSQVVRRGVVDRTVTRLPWRQRADHLWSSVEQSLRELEQGYELVLIEGAGSPAETNLRTSDIANMRVAEAADAPVMLVADIDRGGAFAHLYGTWALLEPTERARLRGFVLNKFRGDATLLAPAPADLARRTGMADLGVLPWLAHQLPDEDGSSLSGRALTGDRPRVAVVRCPTMSNLDEFTALSEVTDLVWAGEPDDLDGAALVVLPGSKHVVADLAWLRSRDLDGAVRGAAAAGTPVLGICGGLQMLGTWLDDPLRVEGAGRGSGWAGGDGVPAPGAAERVPGLGLLPIVTTFEREKLTARPTVDFGELPSPWQPWSGRRFAGYEIRHGRSRATAPVDTALPDDRGFVDGNVLGVSVHGLFEDTGLLSALLGVGAPTALDAVFDQLADAVEEHLDTDAIWRMASVSGGAGGPGSSRGAMRP